MSEVTITGLDLTKRIMRDQGDDIAYIALSEINEKNRPVGAARVDFSNVGLGPWLKRDSGDEEEDESDEDEPDDENGADEVADLRDAPSRSFSPRKRWNSSASLNVSTPQLHTGSSSSPSWWRCPSTAVP